MTNDNSTCFWALLSPEQFRFIYMPSLMAKVTIDGVQSIANLLLNRPFLEIIHPDERALAQADLANFSNAQRLAGSITRCRVLSFRNIALQQSKPQVSFTGQNVDQWIIFNVIMYIVTDSLILAFFHEADPSSGEDGSTKSNLPFLCGQLGCEPHDIVPLTNELQRYCASQFADSQPQPQPQQLFQIFEGEQPIMTWPPNQHSEELLDTTKHVMLKETFMCSDNRCNGTESVCTHHHHSSSIVALSHGLHRIERIIVPYGRTVFAAFCISPIASRPPQQQYMQHPDQNGTYQHFIHCSSASMHQPLDLQQREQLMYSRHSTSTIALSNQHRLACMSTHWTLNEENEATNSTTPVEMRVCSKCRTTTSPEWRKGPSGNKTLCNACGLRFSRLVQKEKRRLSRPRQ